MRLLCIDHYFVQDIDALKAAAGSHGCWAVGPNRLYNAATRIFPEELKYVVEAYFKPAYAGHRRRFAAEATAQMERLQQLYRFDAVLAPSDTFFWLRPAIAYCQRVGIPFAVLQKEATIPPGYMDVHTKAWGASCPFIADRMYVSSENHERFWVRYGTDPSIITVTGQPRFDVYASPGRPAWRDLGVDVGSGDLPTVLFLTYDAAAYVPVTDPTGLVPWLEQRTDTERVLVELAAQGRVHVLVKGHPQGFDDQTAQLEQLGRRPGVTVLDPGGDVRRYIKAADVVVGFQSTALLESLAAGRPTIYTWWSEAAARYADDVIPFHRERGALTVIESPDGLREAVLAAARDRGRDRPPNLAAKRLVEEYLGPIDGHASERVWGLLEQLVAETRARRGAPALRRPVPRAATAAASLGERLAWSAARAFPDRAYELHRRVTRGAGPDGPAARQLFRRQLEARQRWADERLGAALTA